MAANRFPAVWLRRFAGLLVLLGVLTLSACGGGSGAPNNPFTPSPPAAATLTVLPAAATVYPGVPSSLTINGGTGPYRILSSNTALLPVASTANGSTISLLAADVSADTKVTVTVLDAANNTASADVTISPTPAGSPLGVLPASLFVQPGVSTTLTVSGGKGPYRAFSSNPAILPVTQAVSGNSITLLAGNVASDTPVTITILDSANNTTIATATVRPAAALSVNPSTATLYSGQPTILTIAGGVGPYRAFSTNSTVVPVTANVSGNTIALVPASVSVDTNVVVTVTDAAGGSQQATLTVKPASLLNTFAITPNLSDCGTTAICSGQTGTAAVKVLGPTGAPAPGRQVRFEVVQGPFSIRTADPNVPAASSQTVVSDASGLAQVIIQANVSAATQPAQIRATDVQSGQQLTTSFIIQQNTNGTSILTVVPDNAIIQGAFKGICPTGARVDYYIYGGTPPYRVTANFPDAVVLSSNIVSTNGGFFEATTTGMCADPVTFSILDASGRQIIAKLTNKEGSADLPTAPAPTALAITPSTLTVPKASCVPNAIFRFAVTGGTQPYGMFFNPPNAATATQVLPGVPGLLDVKLLSDLSAGGTLGVNAFDVSSPQKVASATLTCQ